MKRQPRSNPRSNKALRTVSIIGTGSYVPEKILTNADLSRMVDTTDDWITTRTGIKERRIAGKDENTSDMATKAALKALEQAKISAKEIDLILVATATPDMLFPATACFVQKKIGATNAACLDISAACAGFLFGLEIAQQFITSHTHDTVLVIGADKLTSITNWTDRNTCVLFGDGAGAAILRHRGSAHGVISTHIGSDGQLHRHFVHARRWFAMPDHAGKRRYAFGNDPYDGQGSLQTGRHRNAECSQKSPRSGWTLRRRHCLRYSAPGESPHHGSDCGSARYLARQDVCESGSLRQYLGGCCGYRIG